MRFRIGTSEAGGTFNRQGEVVGALLRDRHDVEIHTIEGSSVANANRLHSGGLEFGFSASNWVGRASRGEVPFEQPIDIRMAAPANVGPMFFITRADSDLRSIDDMRGRKVSVNIRESGMYQHVRTIFGLLGISFDDFEPVHLNFEEGGEALASGEIDAQWQCPVPNPVMTSLAERLDVRVLEYGDGQLEQVIAGAGYYRPTYLCPGDFKGIAQDSAQVGVLNVITTHARVNDDVVAELVSAMIGNATVLGERETLYKGLADLFQELKSKGASVFEPDGVPFHPGAVRAYREAGLIP
jgi:hypothetical protein